MCEAVVKHNAIGETLMITNEINLLASKFFFPQISHTMRVFTHEEGFSNYVKICSKLTKRCFDKMFTFKGTNVSIHSWTVSFKWGF